MAYGLKNGCLCCTKIISGGREEMEEHHRKEHGAKGTGGERCPHCGGNTFPSKSERNRHERRCSMRQSSGILTPGTQEWMSNYEAVTP